MVKKKKLYPTILACSNRCEFFKKAKVMNSLQAFKVIITIICCFFLYFFPVEFVYFEKFIQYYWFLCWLVMVACVRIISIGRTIFNQFVQVFTIFFIFNFFFFSLIFFVEKTGVKEQSETCMKTTVLSSFMFATFILFAILIVSLWMTCTKLRYRKDSGLMHNAYINHKGQID